MWDQLKKNFSNIIFLILGGLSASYFESLRKYFENGLINFGSTMNDTFYTDMSNFEPYSESLKIILLSIVTLALSALLILTRKIISESDARQVPYMIRTLNLHSIYVIIVFMLFISYKTAVYSVYSEANKNFEKTIIIMSTFVAEEQIKEYKANWALMRTKKEYLELKRSMDARSKGIIGAETNY